MYLLFVLIILNSCIGFMYLFNLLFLNSCINSIHVFVGRAKRAPHWGIQSRFRVIYIYIYMLSVCCMSVVCQINCVGGITWPTHTLKVF